MVYDQIWERDFKDRSVVRTNDILCLLNILTTTLKSGDNRFLRETIDIKIAFQLWRISATIMYWLRDTSA